MPSSWLQQAPNHNAPTKWKKSMICPSSSIPAEQSARQRKRNGFPSTPRLASGVTFHRNKQFCADWPRSSQANGNIWLEEVQAELWQGSPIHWHNLHFQLNFPAQYFTTMFLQKAQCLWSERQTFQGKIDVKIKSHFPWHFTSMGSTSISLPISAYGVKGSDASWTKHHIHKLQCQSGLGWRTGQLNLNPFIE